MPIIGGLKLAGQTGNWNIGVLNITDKTDSAYRNFSVGRISHFIGKQSYIGVIGTRGDAIGAEGNWLAGADIKLASSNFLGNKNLIFTGFGLKSASDGFSGQQYSFGGDFSYPNDFIDFRIGHQQIGENFRAGIGFVPRLGIRESYGNLFIGPRPNRWGIMKINTGGMIDYITNMDNKLLTRDVFLKVLEFEFLSGEKLEYALMNTYEFLDEDFNIFPKDSVTIPAGTYDFWQQSIEAYTAKRRNFWIGTELDWGHFFGGNITTWQASWGWKIGIPFFAGLEYEQNHVTLSDREFTTRIYRINADIYFSPDISLSNYVQYDNVTDQWGWQSRFRWIIKPGNEIFLVWNSVVEQSLNREKITLAENNLRFKVNYNFRF